MTIRVNGLSSGRGRLWLPTLFWVVAGGDALFLLIVILRGPSHPLEVLLIWVFLPVLLVIVLAIMGVVAIVRRGAAYGIGLALVAVLPLVIGSIQLQRFAEYAAAPSTESVQTGRAYFDTEAERKLAAAIAACDSPDDSPNCDFASIDGLARAADVNQIGHGGKTFMDLALDAGGIPEVVGSLLRAGETADDAQRKAMAYACTQGRPKLVRIVLAAGADPNMRAADGTPFLIRATATPDALAAFLDAGADVNAEARDGQTALMEAVFLWDFDSIAMLLAHGAREDQIAKDGRTLDKLVAVIPPAAVAAQHVPPEVDAFIKRHQPR